MRMKVSDLKEQLADIPEDSEVNIVSSGLDPEINYCIDKIIFDTVEDLFIEVSPYEI